MKSLVKGISVVALAAMAVSVAVPAFAHQHPTTVVSADQGNGGQAIILDGDNKAAINAFAFASASGNIGANDASGNANQQSNISYIDSKSGLKNVLVFSDQHNGGNIVIGSGGSVVRHNYHTKVVFQTANIQGHAFDNASGNIGANVASGNLNQQSNVAVVLSKDQLSFVLVDTDQHTGGSLYLFDGLNKASIGDSAFRNASGNIGANVAAGNANQQSNTLVVNSNDTP